MVVVLHLLLMTLQECLSPPVDENIWKEMVQDPPFYDQSLPRI